MDRMQRSNKEGFFYRVRTHPLFIFVICVLIALLSRSVYRLYGAYTEARAKSIRAEGELGRVSRRKEEVDALVNGLRTERGREAEIRSRYQVVKEGERVVLFGALATSTPSQ